MLRNLGECLVGTPSSNSLFSMETSPRLITVSRGLNECSRSGWQNQGKEHLQLLILVKRIPFLVCTFSFHIYFQMSCSNCN